MKLSGQDIKLIQAAVDQLFDRAKARFLGPNVGPKRLYLGFVPNLSLPGLFNSAAAEERAVPDKDTLHTLMETAGSYLDSYRESAKAQVVQRVQSFLSDARASGVSTDAETVLGGELASVWKKVSTDVRRLVDTESTGARNRGTLEGIVRVNEANGEDDPVVFWVVVRDGHRCSECTKLHLLDDGVTPRVWRLSEVSNGYHKRGDPAPSIAGLHPHCRCSMATLMKGYGFDAGGMVKFIGFDHDEFKKQRG